MGRSKKQRREAVATNAQPMPRLAPKEPPKTTLNTCLVMGNRLTLDGPRVVVQDHDRIAYPKHPEPGDLHPGSVYALGYRVSPPLRIHQRTTEGPLGGNAFAGPLIRYMDAGTKRGTSFRRLSYSEKYWWTPDWAEAELRASYDADLVDIVLSVCRDGQDWDTALLGSGRALGDVLGYMRGMARHCQAIIRSEAQREARAA